MIQADEAALRALERFLAPSGLTPQDVPSWQYVDPFTLNVRLGLGVDSPHRAQSDGILIPYYGLDGKPMQVNGLPYYRARLLQPRAGKQAAKYLSMIGASPRLYIPPASRARINQGQTDLLIVTEGEKKAELLAKWGWCAVGLAGISCGLVRKAENDPRLLLPDLEEVVGRMAATQSLRVLVLFDAEGRPRSSVPESEDAALWRPINRKLQGWVRNYAVYIEAVMLARALSRCAVGVATKACWADRIDPPVSADNPWKAGVDDWMLSIGAEAFSQWVVEQAEQTVTATGVQSSGELREEGYTPLGIESGKAGELLCVLWSRRNGKMVRLSAADMSRQATWLSVFGPAFVRSRWVKHDKEGRISGVDLMAAQSEVIASCQARSEWRPSRERGGGVWAEGGGLRINALEGLFHCAGGDFEALTEDDRHRGENIYPRTADYAIGLGADYESVLERVRDVHQRAADMQALIDHFGCWGGLGDRASVGAMLLAGWVAAQSLLGALKARPSLLICGESGAGKSMLAEHISEILGKTALRIDDGASATEPGIRQRLGKNAQTLLLDEAEPGSNNAVVGQQRASNLRRILNLLRAAYSTTDSETTLSVASLKGGADGRPVDYSLRTCAALFAIGLPDLEQADRNRLIVLEIRKEGRAQRPPCMQGLSQLGLRIRLGMWLCANDFFRLLEHIERLMSLRGIEARLAKTWGTALAGCLCFSPSVHEWLQKGQNDPHIDDDLLAQIDMVRLDQEQRFPGRPLESDAERALQTLMRARIRVQLSQTDPQGGLRYQNLDVSVSEALYRVYLEAVDAGQRRAFLSDWQISLKRYGLAYLPDENNGHAVFVSDSGELRRILAGTPYVSQNIETLLARLPGAVRKQSRLAGGLRMYGVCVPFEMHDAQGQVVEKVSDPLPTED